MDAPSTLQRIRQYRPQPSPWLLSRPRLLEQLGRARYFPMTVVSGPAGTGKTTLISDWAGRQAGPLVWLMLDATDDGLDQFLASCLGAIRARFPGVGAATLSLMGNGGMASPQHYAAALADEFASLDQDAFLVLDDFHLLRDPDVLVMLDAFLGTPPPRVHLVIGSRDPLPAGLMRHRSLGRVLEIPASQLLFDADEIARYFTGVLGAPSSQRDLERYANQTEGWALGLHHVAMSLQATPMLPQGASRTFSAQRDSHEFLRVEVLGTLPPVRQAFMARIAIPTQVSADLAEDLAADLMSQAEARAVFVDACQRGLFLSPLDERGEWFQMHPLMREVALDYLVGQIGPTDVGKLHAVARDWFVAQGDIDAAISHALVSDQPDSAVTLASAHAQQALAQDRWLVVERWIGLLEQASRDLPLDLLVAQAMIHQMRGRYTRLLATVQAIREQMQRQRAVIPAGLVELIEADLAVLSVFARFDPDGVDRNITDLTTAHARLVGSDRFTELLGLFLLASFWGLRDPDAARRAVDDVLAAHQFHRDPFSRLRVAWALCSRSILASYQGHLHDQIESSRQSMQIARQHGGYRLAALVGGFTGSAWYELNELDRAETQLREVIDDPYSGALVLVTAVSLLGKCLNAQGREEECDDLLESFVHRMLECEQTDNVFNLRSTMARVAYLRGETSRALALIDSIQDPPDRTDFRTIEISWLLKAQLLTNRGTATDLAEAESLIADAERALDTYQVASARFQLQIARAYLELQNGNIAASAQRTHDLLLQVERTGFVRLLLDQGGAATAILSTVAAESPFARTLLQHLTARERSGARPAGMTGNADPPALTTIVADPLTDRELEILHGLSQRLTNKEIAQVLSISPLTVKSHARNLYAKLGVNSRRQAITRGEVLGLLPMIERFPAGLPRP